jgi:ABC-type glycerol-3-phosphate transport system permease component
MPIIDPTGRRHWKIRLVILSIYLLLTLLGVMMVYPFLITVSSSVSSPTEYYRYAPLPGSFFSRDERFVRLLTPYFPAQMRLNMDQFSLFFRNVPQAWTSWTTVGDDRQGIATFARSYLAMADNPVTWRQVQCAAKDYADFTRRYPSDDAICAYNERQVAPYLRDLYLRAARAQLPAGASEKTVADKALSLLRDRWGVPIASFYIIKPERAWDQTHIIPYADGRAQDFASLRDAYRDGQLAPVGVPTSTLWINETRPAPLKLVWLRFLASNEAAQLFHCPAGATLRLEQYNAVAHTRYSAWRDIAFPVPSDAPAPLRAVWEHFVQTSFPMRLIEVVPSAQEDQGYQRFVRDRFKDKLDRYNNILGLHVSNWSDIHLSPHMPVADEAQASLWGEFVSQLPVREKTLHCAEIAFQEYLRARYGTVDRVNAAYGWHLAHLEEAEMPLDMAYLATFNHNDWHLFAASLSENYRFVIDFLLYRGQAVRNTFILVLLTLLTALTVNPLAAYALSRFQMRQTASIILFLLATMAFPAAVTMIPGFLIMRDLHLLNTYWALILPGVANGMSIFLLKGYFDSLPAELYEAATLDGAPEWMIFMRITLPLSKPILAVIALNSFMAAYSAWEWAVVVCQQEKMWTVAVWLFQFNSTWVTQPWAIMASFVVTSIPVLVIYLCCQNIILRGIVLPQMK